MVTLRWRAEHKGGSVTYLAVPEGRLQNRGLFKTWLKHSGTDCWVRDVRIFEGLAHSEGGNAVLISSKFAWVAQTHASDFDVGRPRTFSIRSAQVASFHLKGRDHLTPASEPVSKLASQCKYARFR